MKDKAEKTLVMEKKMTRAEFLSLTGKVAAGVGLFVLFSKLAGLFPGDKKRGFTFCKTSGICANCSVVRSCELPQALSYRSIKGGKI